jgi:uncharacterized membrane-anchored protein YitT (DUF2179 family)
VVRTAVIITDHPEQVSAAIFAGLGRGVTAWEAKGMYTGQPHTMLYVTIARSQVTDLRRIIAEVDPQSFMVIGQGHSAYGEGFQRRTRPLRSNPDEEMF